MTDSEIDISVNLDFGDGEIGKNLKSNLETDALSMEAAKKIRQIVFDDLGISENKYAVKAIEAPNVVHLGLSDSDE